MRKAAALISTCLATTLLSACSSAEAPITPVSPGAVSTADARPDGAGRPSLPSITEIAVGNPDFSTLVAAVSKAGLVDFFNGNQHFTVFAPTNAAFDAAAAALGFASGPALVAALDVNALTGILTYHVTRGDRNATSVVSAGTLIMLDGNRTSVTVTGTTARINDAAIVATDIRARNGIVHVIGGVLLPPR